MEKENKYFNVSCCFVLICAFIQTPINFNFCYRYLRFVAEQIFSENLLQLSRPEIKFIQAPIISPYFALSFPSGCLFVWLLHFCLSGVIEVMVSDSPLWITGDGSEKM